MMIDPVAISIFGFSIYWYGLTYVLGFLFSYFFILHFSKEFGIKKEHSEEIFLYVLIASIVGGRLFYMIFYNSSFYISNPSQILAVWNGGMSIHGGLIGSILALYYSSKKYKIKFLKLTDLFILPASFGLAFGRLANFINQELVGVPTSSGYGVIFPLHDDVKRVPYQIIASTKNIIVFQILLYLYFFKKLKTGILTAWFLILYNGLRFFIDFFREATVSLGLISMGQLLSLVFMFFGIYILIKIHKD